MEEITEHILIYTVSICQVKKKGSSKYKELHVSIYLRWHWSGSY